MTFSSVDLGGISEVVRKLSHAIDFGQDLPANWFVGEGYFFGYLKGPCLILRSCFLA